jgi:Ion transport protein
MRFSIWFREVMQRSLHVLPLLAGPIFLILTTMHVFAYIGIALWGDAIDPNELGQNGNVEDLFYLNNFNTYGQGLVTIFNVMVVNDWHQIAKYVGGEVRCEWYSNPDLSHPSFAVDSVFLYATRCSSPYIVYPFFVLVVIIAVCVMLNVIVAFFVESKFAAFLRCHGAKSKPPIVFLNF